MINTAAFIKTVNDLNLSGHLLEVALVCWNRAEKAILKEDWQEPVLIGKQKTKEVKEINKPENEFTQQDLQRLKAFLEKKLENKFEQLDTCKKFADYYWNFCDVNDKSGKHQKLFKNLNTYREATRTTKQQIKNLSEIQRKIKHKLGNP